jgi:hypothetical protein
MAMAKHGPRAAALRNGKQVFQGGVDYDATKGLPSSAVTGSYRDDAEAARVRSVAPSKGRSPISGKG